MRGVLNRRLEDLPLSAPMGRRGRVRWGHFKRLANGFQNTVEVIENLAVPRSDHAIAVAREFCAALLIRKHSISMLPTIKFDNELACRTREIGDAAADRMLAAKSPRHDSLAQGAPKNALNVSRVAPKLARNQCSRSQGHRRPHLTLALSAPSGRRGDELAMAPSIGASPSSGHTP